MILFQHAKPLGHILISDLVVANQSVHTFTARYDSTLLGCTIFTLKVSLDELYSTNHNGIVLVLYTMAMSIKHERHIDIP